MRLFFCLFSILLFPAHAWLQCTNQVTHLSGTQVIGCTSVTVTPSDSYASSIIDYCTASTQPYWIGYDNSVFGSGTGDYTFTFNPPVTAATLNFSAISSIDAEFEKVILYVNGTHYAIPAIGTTNNCEVFATLNTDGDIMGEGSGGGWNGTTITGPITTLRVENFTTSASMAGSVFSLFICDSPNNLHADLGNDTTLCEGEELVLDPQAGDADLNWQDGSSDPTFTVTTTGVYSVVATLNGCTASDFVMIRFNDTVNIDLGADTLLCIGDTLVLDPNAWFTSLTWQDGSSAPIFEVITAGTYWVESLLNGCRSSDTVEVSYMICNSPGQPVPPPVIEMPNVFSPDGDGLNDVFIPVLLDGITEATLTILNRWGNKVFSGNLAAGWDGKTDGKSCSEGVYFYQVDYQGLDGSRHGLHGSVTLVR